MAESRSFPRTLLGPQLRRVSLFTSAAGVWVSMLSQAAAFVSPLRVPAALYRVLVYAASAALVASWLTSGSLLARRARVSQFRRAADWFVLINWLAFAFLYCFLVGPKPGVTTDAPNFTHWFALWTIGERAYESLYLAWMAACALLLFSIVLRSEYTERRAPDRKERSEASQQRQPKKRVALLTGVLIGIFVPPLILLGIGHTTLVESATAASLVTLAVFWLLCAVILVGVSLIVSGARQ